MFFDRYEIHIQDFEDFYGDLHHFPVPVFDFSTFQNFEIHKSKISKIRNFEIQKIKNWKIQISKLLNIILG